tara:strand:+ start:1271 stop:2320 length:1050 start_codon:yes stop_codon:yes gene_type:complete
LHFLVELIFYSGHISLTMNTLGEDVESDLEKNFAVDMFDVGVRYDLQNIFPESCLAKGKQLKSDSVIINYANCNILMVTLRNVHSSKKSSNAQALSYFEQSAFFWQSAPSKGLSSLGIKEIIEKSLETVLFCRIVDQKESYDTCFLFCGSLMYEDHQNSRPINMRFRCLDFRPGLFSHMDSIFDWRPRGYTQRLEIQNYNLKLAIRKILQNSASTQSCSATRNNRRQGLTDQLLFGDRLELACAFCLKKLPISLLQATYIKPKQHCLSDELYDQNNLLPLCKLGCSNLFVQGFLVVEDDGVIKKKKGMHAPQDLRICLNRLAGEKCGLFSEATAGYFKKRLSGKSIHQK